MSAYMFVAHFYFAHSCCTPSLHTLLRTQEVTAVTGVHLVRLPPAPPDDPRGPRALSPAPDWELWRDAWAAWLPRLPSRFRWMAAGPPA